MNQKKAKKLRREAYGKDDPSGQARRYANDPSEFTRLRLVKERVVWVGGKKIVTRTPTGAIKIETTNPLQADPSRRYYKQLKKPK